MCHEHGSLLMSCFSMASSRLILCFPRRNRRLHQLLSLYSSHTCSLCTSSTKYITPTNSAITSRTFSQFSEHISKNEKTDKETDYSPLFTKDAKKKEILDSIIRVDQAGEFGARRIYKGQMDVFGRHTALGKLIEHMDEQEAEHQQTFDRLISEYRVRPTAMQPIWEFAGYAMGYATALLGKEAAMACTVAVETEIGHHYNDQLRELSEAGIDDPQLREYIKKFRDDELEHLDIGLENDAERAPLYDTLYNAIRGATRSAIWLSKRV